MDLNVLSSRKEEDCYKMGLTCKDECRWAYRTVQRKRGRKRVLPEAGSRLRGTPLVGYQVQNAALHLGSSGAELFGDVGSGCIVSSIYWRPPAREVYSSTQGFRSGGPIGEFIRLQKCALWSTASCAGLDRGTV